MLYSIGRRCVFCLLIFCSVSTVQAASPKGEAAAHRTLDALISAWNAGDIIALRKAMNFPNITLAGSMMMIAETPQDFTTDFEGLREREGWAKSAFDKVTITSSSEGKVHCNVAFSRLKADGSVYRQASVFYVITKKDGHWGMQFRGPDRIMRDEFTAEESVAVESAKGVVRDFFDAFNSGDNAALLKTLNLPHAFLFGNGGVAIGRDASGPGVVMDFDGMRTREGWYMSSIDSLTTVQVGANSVSFELVFSRYHRNGMKYRTVPALWVITKKDGLWGVQIRSLMPAVFSD